MNTIAVIAAREFSDCLRNRWLLAASALFAVLVLVLALLGSAPVGQLKASPLEVAVVSLTSLGVYLIPLIALMISFDCVAGEYERGTLALLLTYPLQRWQLLLGKYLGLLAVTVLAIIIGYGSGGLYLALSQDAIMAGWQSFGLLIASSVLLGAVFLALGTLISCLANSRSTALAMALVLWFTLLLFYDLGLLGIVLAADEPLLDQQQFAWLLLLNPADAYRLMNLSSPTIGKLVGIWGASDISIAQALSMMLTWLIASLLWASHKLANKEL